MSMEGRLMGSGTPISAAVAQACYVQAQIPRGGLFAGQDWRISPEPFALPRTLTDDFENLGRVLLTFYRAVNLLYRQSVAGKEPSWVADWLDLGKPAELI